MFYFYLCVFIKLISTVHTKLLFIIITIYTITFIYLLYKTKKWFYVQFIMTLELEITHFNNYIIWLLLIS